MLEPPMVSVYCANDNIENARHTHSRRYLFIVVSILRTRKGVKPSDCLFSVSGTAK